MSNAKPGAVVAAPASVEEKKRELI